MSETKHTPAPNELEAKCAELERQLEGYINAFDCINEAMGFAHRAITDPDSIAVIDLPTESKDADARLIAAAPDMLEALKQAHAMIHDHDFGGAIITIEDAIAKAEGRQQ